MAIRCPVLACESEHLPRRLAAPPPALGRVTLRMFGVSHFVHLATALSAVAAVLPLLPVATVALPAVLELFFIRGQPLKALALAALHIGAYTVGRMGGGQGKARLFRQGRTGGHVPCQAAAGAGRGPARIRRTPDAARDPLAI